MDRHFGNNLDLSALWVIRAIPFSDWIKPSGQVHKKAFKPGKHDSGFGLSAYKNLPKIDCLENAERLATWHSQTLASGDLCGLCYLLESRLLELNLEIYGDPYENENNETPFFGDQHILIGQPDSPDLCPDEDKREQLALIATLSNRTGFLKRTT